ncbi:MAG: SCP2 sterol-binding domain-containing protein [Candidatus Velamenicoccus archaeovorus]
MPMQFLSEEWTAELNRRLNADEEFKKGIAKKRAKLLQVIATGDGEKRYWIHIEDGAIDIGLGDIDAPDATITEDYETAVGMATGQVNAVSAFMTGKLKISGNMMMLMGLQSALSGLPRVMQEMDVDY